MYKHSEIQMNAQSSNQTPFSVIERRGAQDIRTENYTYKPSKRNSQFSFPEYRMDRIPRGYCVIINNRHFYKENGDHSWPMPDRNGTEKDAEYLRYTFSRLHFIVRQQDNLSDTEMMKFLCNIGQDDDNERYDCFVCVILTHGVLNHIYGSNGKLVAIKDVTAIFQPSRCKGLLGKPKIFFIQACQGREKMTGAVECRDDEAELETDTVVSNRTDATRCVQSLFADEFVKSDYAESSLTRTSITSDITKNHITSTDIQCDGDRNSDISIDSGHRENIPDEADFLIGYATVSGYVSFRSRNHGSWYIRKLCEILDSHADRCDLLSILTEVNRQVATANAPMDGSLYKQVPAPYSTLRKLVFFR
ncbi:caspase-3-like isoform X2 [Mercenaria mercenaria]|nr:caspase-3-like isoform X2 [Mercenaria mercenaria]